MKDLRTLEPGEPHHQHGDNIAAIVFVEVVYAYKKIPILTLSEGSRHSPELFGRFRYDKDVLGDHTEMLKVFPEPEQACHFDVDGTGFKALMAHPFIKLTGLFLRDFGNIHLGVKVGDPSDERSDRRLVIFNRRVTEVLGPLALKIGPRFKEPGQVRRFYRSISDFDFRIDLGITQGEGSSG
jgi:hypothetical protein